jgi:AcrR family transcriptional regulator
MPTGIHLRDPRGQLFSAAERVLLQDGPSALTSRVVTDEAGCAKGVLHRHFESFDAFVAEFVLDRIGRMEAEGEALRESAGSGAVVDNLTDALLKLFGPVALSIVTIVIFQVQVRARLRAARSVGGVPVLAEAGMILSGYLAAERDLGRVAPDADLESLVPLLIGAVHLLFAGSDGRPPERAAVREVVTTVLAGVLTGR